jgi:hypothetical protein
VNGNRRDDWQWRYSGWLGIMYGPVPVGWIAGMIGLCIFFLVL